MKKAKPPVTYETRYKHKLNMLEPGAVMLKWIGIFLLAGIVLRLLRLKLVSYIVFGLAEVIFLLLLILLTIEAHQDSVLMTMALSLSIELLQPLINSARSADITDVITNTIGGLIGYVVYAIFVPREPANTK